MKILVTGATGFIGFHTVRALAERGHDARVLVRDLKKATRVLAPLRVPVANVIVGDMTDARAVGRAVEDCDGVVHCAATVSVTQSVDDEAFEANTEGARCVISRAVAAGVQRGVFLSSLTAIFDPRAGALDPALPLVASATRYGQSKVASDRVVRELQDAGAGVHIVYPSGVVGPDDPGKSESMRAHTGFVRQTIRAGGTQLVDVRDLAALNVALLERGGAERVVAAGHYFTWDELADLYEEVSGGEISRIGLPGWALRTVGSVADRLAAWTGRSFGPFTREALEVATRWWHVPDSPIISQLGVKWRDPRDTVEAVLRWGLENGRVRPEAAPRLSQIAG
jgi:nucleoside-diphosphate-sugar epimerase